jgi:glucokinase
MGAVLAGDIGGTKTLLALAQADGDLPRIVFEQRYASGGFGDFESMLDTFLAEARAAGATVEPLDHACFGVAGPIDGRRAKPTYLPWTLDADRLSQRLGSGGSTLVNDFAAAAAGVLTLAPDELVTLQAGSPQPHAPRVVVGAGTGLGVAILVHGGDRSNDDWQVISGEGGHVGFAPGNEEQVELWHCLRQRHERVTVERVVCGAGLVDIYRCLVASGRAPDQPDPLQAADAAASIAAAASRQEQTALHAMRMFVEAYGAFAGDLGLTVMARGGVFIAGGIAPKILPWLSEGPFLAAFNAKKGHAALTRAMPVFVVTNEKLGLRGAARLALGAVRGR